MKKITNSKKRELKRAIVQRTEEVALERYYDKLFALKPAAAAVRRVIMGMQK